MQMDIETELAPAAEPVGPDWDRIRADYEAGTLSIREIAAREGISDTAIHKRARANGWDTGLRKGLHEQPANQVQTTPSVGNDAVERIIEALKTTKPAEDDGDFDWADVENDDVLVWDRPAIAVYRCATGQILLRAEARDPRDDVACIRLDPRDVPALIRRLQELAR